MPTVVVRPESGAPLADITVAAPLAQAGPGILFIRQATPGYILGLKKRQEVGSQAEPPLRQFPIEIPIPDGVTIFVSLTEVTAGIDPKVGNRTFKLRAQITNAAGALVHEEELHWDNELTSTAGTGGGTTVFGSTGSPYFTPIAQQPGVLFQKGSQQQPNPALKAFFVTVA